MTFLQSQFLRFAAVGTAGFVVNEIALAAMIKLIGLDPYSGQIASFLVAVTFTWWGNRMLTFRAEADTGSRGIAEEWLRYVAANALGFAVNYSVYASLVRFAAPPANSPFLALAAGTIAGLAFNFTLSKRLVFRGQR